MPYSYKHGVIGGTFDHLHVGHHHFIQSAFAQAKFITLGLVVDPSSPQKSLPNQIEPYSLRLQNLVDYLHSSQLLKRSSIIPLQDIYGPTLQDKTLDSIFVTDSTYQNADVINHQRVKLGLAELAIVKIAYKYSDNQSILSSSDIRAGKVDRHGQSYLKFFLRDEVYTLPASLHKSLKHPLGAVITRKTQLPAHLPPSSTIIAVGDIVSIKLQQAGYSPAICVVDYKTRRKALPKSQLVKYFTSPSIHINNPASHINPQFANILLDSLSLYAKTKQTQLVVVSGEEDLLALPSILLAPLGSYVIYGQYGLGMCLVEVTETTKSLAKLYLSKFERF